MSERPERRRAEPSGLTGRTWLVLVLLGLSGQIAWNVENSWFNTFVYDEVTPDPRPIAVMVAVSAAVATLTTLLMGAWSDRLGRRKPFIAVGYVAWALSVAAYPAAAAATSVTLAIVLVVLLDAVMTFFGSTANDAAFNAWVTDVTHMGNRGRIDGLLQVMPVLATMIGMGASGFLIDRFGYTPFFLTLGGLVLVMGLVGSALLHDSPRLAPAAQPGGYWRGLVHELAPAQLRANADLYLVFTAMAVASIGVQVSAPYEVVYLNHTLGLSKATVGVITAMVAPILVLFALPIGWLTDRGRGFAVLVAGLIVAALGTAAFAFAQSLVPLALAAVVKSVVFLMMIVLMAWHRHLLPPDARGTFQGIRLIFMVLAPMVIGPAIGSALIRVFGRPAMIEGRAGHLPPSLIYLVSALVIAATLVPVWLLHRRRGGRPPGARRLSAG